MKKNRQTEDTPPTLSFALEVSGCRHACSFCWADGRHYPPMDIADVERILDKTAAFCQSEGLKFEPYPMHEVMGHPDALRILEICKHHCGYLFHPLTTPGLALVSRSDCDNLLHGIKSLGVTTLWFTLHGVGDVHNRIVHYTDAFAATIEAVKLCKNYEFKCGANVLVTKESVVQTSQIIDLAHEIGLDQVGFEISHYKPIPRLRKYEALRPTLNDLMPYSETLRKHSIFWKQKWGDLSKYTEAHYVGAALHPQDDGDVQWSTSDRNRIRLVCRSGLKLHTGDCGAYGPFHGNLVKGHVHDALCRAVQAGPCSDESLYFPGMPIPSPADLARDWGDSTGQKVYFNVMSMRLRWLDLASGRA